MEIDLTSFSVSTPTAASAAQQQQSQSQQPPPPSGPPPPAVDWAIHAKEKTAYETRFQQLVQGEDAVSGKDAVPFLALSKLPTETLRKIWELSDADMDGKLNRSEFSVAMHLVMKARAGVPMPVFLPEVLTTFVKSGGVAANGGVSGVNVSVNPSTPSAASLKTVTPPASPRPPPVHSSSATSLGSGGEAKDTVSALPSVSTIRQYRSNEAPSPQKQVQIQQKRLSLAETMALGTGTGVDVNKKFVPSIVKGELDKILKYYQGDTSLFNRAVLSYLSENAKTAGVILPCDTFAQRLWHYFVDEELHKLLAELDHAKRGHKKEAAEEHEGAGSEGEEDDDEPDEKEEVSPTGGFSGMLDKVKQATLRSAHVEAMSKRNSDNQKILLDMTGEKWGLVNVHLIEAWGLKGQTKSGKSDSFCEVYVLSDQKEIKDIHANNTFTTKIQTKEQDPFWNEDCFLAVGSKKDVIVVDVQHFTSTITQKRIGRVLIPVCALSKKHRADFPGTDPAIEGWFSLLDSAGNISTYGSVYLKLVLTRPLPRTSLSDWVAAVEMPDPSPATLSVFCGTWNLGNYHPPDDLSQWIPVGPHDLYVVSTQECKYNARFDYNTCRDDWLGTLTKHFGSQYTMVKYHSLWAIRLAVFVAKQHVHRIHAITFHTEATGIGTVLGNKGAVVTAFEIDHRPVCFIGAHCAAHQDKVAARNDNIRAILKSSKVGKFYTDGTRIDPINQFDHIMFCGDLNYRIAFGDQPTKTPPPHVWEAMVKKIQEGSALELLQYDQLKSEQAGNRALVGFKEFDTGFREGFKPTFKVEVGKALEYNTMRSPAWTDRILWRSLPGMEQTLKPSSYAYCPAILTSDHKPVSATFDLESLILPPAFDNRVGKCRVKFHLVKASDLLSLDARALLNEQHREALRVEQKKEVKRGAAASAMAGAFKAIKSSARASTTNPVLRCSAHFWGGKEYTSQVCKDTLFPYWRDFDKRECLYNNPERLQQSKIYIQVLSQTSLSHDTLGYTVLSLHNTDLARLAHSQQGKNVSVEFNLDLTYAGLPAGHLTGTLQFEWTSWGGKGVEF